VRGWVKSLESFIRLEPEHLVPCHTQALEGKVQIKEHLANYRDAILHVHNETVRCMNEGKTADEAVSEVRLSPQLAEKEYLRELYGRVGWSVRGIYRGYSGWYDGKGTGLNSLPPSYKAMELVRLAGGVDKVLARAIELQQKDEHQLCAELCDLVIEANPDEPLAHRIKAASMIHLAMGSRNLNSFGFYRSAYGLEMKAARELEQKRKQP
jgi:alkyl sulfatase BDS1-like metallo-beta-lactamase superfamily hydrolase